MNIDLCLRERYRNTSVGFYRYKYVYLQQNHMLVITVKSILMSETLFLQNQGGIWYITNNIIL